jgi:HAMP domain-containing protein
VPQTPRDRSLTTTLLLIATAQIVLPTTAVITLTTLNGQRGITNLAGQLMDTLSDHTITHIHNLLQTAETINRDNILSITNRNLDLNNPKQLNQQFWHQKNLYQGFLLSAIYYGNNQGEFTGLGFQSNQKWERTYVNATTQNRFQPVILDDQGQDLTQQPLGKPYDPRQRPWYIKAQRQGEATWSDTFKDFTENRYKISLAEPLYTPDGRLQGVFGTDLLLNRASEFLKTLDLKGPGEIYLINRQGNLIASNQDQQFKVTLQQIQHHFGNLQAIQTPTQLTLNINNQPHFLNIRPFGKIEGLDWLIVVNLPQANFTQQIAANTRQTLFLSLLSLLLSLISAILTSRWIARPIHQLSQATQTIAQGQFDSPITLDSSREDSAITELDGAEWMGRQLRLNKAKPKGSE